jgi:hypothetical protein
LRLEALPLLLLLLLLVLPYAVFSSASSNEACPSQPGRIASKPYADADSRRVNLLRPARVQARIQRGHDLSGKTGGGQAKDLGLTLAGYDPRNLLQVAARTPVAYDAPPSLLLFRTRNPRDPPRVI